MVKQKQTILLVSLIVISSFFLCFSIQRNSSGVSAFDNPVTRSQEDLTIEFTTNQSGIGKDSGALGTLVLRNNGANAIGNIAIDFGLDGKYVEITTGYAQHQELSLLNPGYSETFNIEVGLNKSEFTGEEPLNMVDLCLVFDSSGSMGEEIEAVKNAFLDIVSNLTEQIDSLRIGAIAYGWAKYSEYPQESPNNYVPFTEDFDWVNDFINSLYPAGGTEPWGDALYLANSWNWRPDANKLLIIVGDEDCDPGKIVGAGSSGSYYNGSQLVEVVENLKAKGVKINSVRTGNEAIFVNQFTWIAEATGGISVDLEELQNGDPPITLPELIESWTLELKREYYIYLYANITWTEFDVGGDITYSTQKGLYLLFDVAPPFISVSTLVIANPDSTFTFQIYATVKDLSGIASTSIYWTFDDLEGGSEPLWHFEILSNISNHVYLKELTGLTLGENLSFYFVAFDSLYNRGESQIYNCTVEIQKNVFGTTTTVYFPTNNTMVTLYFDLAKKSYGYLRLDNFIGSYSLLPNSNFTLETKFVSGDEQIVRVIKTGLEDFAVITFIGNTTADPMSIFWNFDIFLIEEELNGYSSYFDVKRTNLLIRVEISNENQLCLVRIDPELIAVVKVFDENWNYIGKASFTEALTLVEGTYYLWAYTVLRDGSFKFYFGDDPPLETDSYYNQLPIPFPILLLIVILALSGFSLLNRRKKHREKQRQRI